MADRKCSLCGTYYTDEEGHNKNECVWKLQTQVLKTKCDLQQFEEALKEALARRHKEWYGSDTAEKGE